MEAPVGCPAPSRDETGGGRVGSGSAVLQVAPEQREHTLPVLFSGLLVVDGPLGEGEAVVGVRVLLDFAIGAFEVIAGLAILIGWQTRIAAWALAGFCILAGLLFHNFWAYEGQEQVAQMLNLFKNVTIAGGFLVLAACGPGRYALDARRGHDVETGRLNIA